MLSKIFLLCLGLGLLAFLDAKPSRDRNDKPYRMVCYLGSWAYYKHSNGKYQLSDFDVNSCTHAIYGFAKIENNRIAAYDPYLDLKTNWGLDYFGHFNRLRQQNSKLSTLIAIGGWNEGTMKYSDMARDPALRSIFVKSCVDFLIEHDFDGLDFDWEYPGSREGSRPDEDRENFVKVLKELRAAFQPHGFLLTAAVSAGKTTIKDAYDIPAVSENLDFINLMAYDYHGAWEQFTGHNAPLYGRPGESPFHQTLNVNFSVNYWLDHGAPKDKLVLGMPLYGRCFTLASSSDFRMGATSYNAGNPWPYSNTAGMVGYNEICEFMKKQQWQTLWEPDHQVPYAVQGNQWCGYDDETSLAIKTNYLKSMGLSGAMVWSLETDDFHGFCGGGKNALVWKIQSILAGHTFSTPQTPAPQTITTGSGHKVTTVSSVISTSSGIVTEDPLSKLCAEGNKKLPIKGDCGNYHQCLNTGKGYRLVVMRCPPGTSFDARSGVCTHSDQVPGCGLKVTTSPAPSVTTLGHITTGQVVQPTPNPLPEGLVCVSEGTFRHPVDCQRFYICIQNEEKWKVVIFTCPEDLVFNKVKQFCDYSTNVSDCPESSSKRH